MRARGVEVVRVARRSGRHVDLGEALALLAQAGVTRVFSEGGPRVGSRLIDQGLADEVVLLTATKPLGREGLPALAPAAYRALEDPARYAEAERNASEPDEMRRWELRLAETAGFPRLRSSKLQRRSGDVHGNYQRRRASH